MIFESDNHTKKYQYIIGSKKSDNGNKRFDEAEVSSTNTRNKKAADQS